MEEWRQVFYHAMNMFNVVIVSYFFMANGIYTLLMLLSLGSVWLHNRRLSYQGLDELRESAVTPPATILVPAWNEQDVIVDSVRSIMRTDYPALEVIVIDDGSTDESMERLISAFRLVKMDLIYRPRLATRSLKGFYKIGRAHV